MPHSQANNNKTTATTAATAAAGHGLVSKAEQLASVQKQSQQKRKIQIKEKSRKKSNNKNLLCNGRFRFAHSNLIALFNGLATIPDNASRASHPFTPPFSTSRLIPRAPIPNTRRLVTDRFQALSLSFGLYSNSTFACRDKNLLHNSKSEAVLRPGAELCAIIVVVAVHLFQGLTPHIYLYNIYTYI